MDQNQLSNHFSEQPGPDVGRNVARQAEASMGPHAERYGQWEHRPLGDELSNPGRPKRKLLTTNKRDAAIYMYTYYLPYDVEIKRLGYDAQNTRWNI